MRIVIVVALLVLASCAPPGRGYYEDPQVAAARMNNSTALIGLGTSMMFQPTYRPRLQQTCSNNWGTVMCYGW